MGDKDNNGKGDRRRKSNISREEEEIRWKLAFGDKNEKEKAKKDLERFHERKS